MLKSYEKYGPFYYMLVCLKQCLMGGKVCAQVLFNGLEG